MVLTRVKLTQLRILCLVENPDSGALPAVLVSVYVYLIMSRLFAGCFLILYKTISLFRGLWCNILTTVIKNPDTHKPPKSGFMSFIMRQHSAKKGQETCVV